MHRARAWALVLLLGSIALYLITRTPASLEPRTTHGDSRPRATRGQDVDRARPPDATVLKGVSVHQNLARGGESALRATELRFQKRIGLSGYLVYQDAREILAKTVAIDIELDERTPFTFPTIPRELLHLLGGEEKMDFGVKPSLLQGAVADAPGAFLSRVRFEDLQIHLSTPPGERLAIHARSGQFHPTTETLILSGGVEIVSPAGDRIETSQAIVSSDLSGLYLPMSHRRNGTTVTARSSITLKPEGSLAAEIGPEPKSWLDPIEELEHLFLSKYLEKIPAAIRMAVFPGIAPAADGS